MKKIATILFVIGITLSQLVLSQVSPVMMLENSANQIIETLKDNQASLKNHKDGAKKLIYQTVKQHLLTHVDIEGMSRSVLGMRVWSQISKSERQEFSSALVKLVIRTYATPLADYNGEKIKFSPQNATANARFSRVNSRIIRTNGQTIAVSYSLVSKNGVWKIYDLSVEGVSLLQSFRSQFSQALQTESIAVLIKNMNERSHGG